MCKFEFLLVCLGWNELEQKKKGNIEKRSLRASVKHLYYDLKTHTAQCFLLDFVLQRIKPKFYNFLLRERDSNDIDPDAIQLAPHSMDVKGKLPILGEFAWVQLLLLKHMSLDRVSCKK